jgi:cobalt/nickel transport system permease protein
VALPFLVAALPLAFSGDGPIVATLELGPVRLTVMEGGLVRLLTIAGKSWLSIQVALLLAFTTPFHDLVDGLRGLGVPRVLVAIIGFMYRYLAVLSDEGSRMLRAREARSGVGARRSGGSIAWRARVTGGLVGSLFLRAYERSERIHAAMQARGFEGRFHHMTVRRITRGEAGALLLLAAVLVAWQAAAHLWLPRA